MNNLCCFYYVAISNRTYVQTGNKYYKLKKNPCVIKILSVLVVPKGVAHSPMQCPNP
jgi:hypothetical protein